MTSTERQDLIQAAKDAAANAYVQYSKQPQGAAVLASNGRIYKGVLVEVANWASTVCPEAAAIAAAVGDGAREFRAVASVPSRFPCGTCLQLLREFGLAVEIVTESEGEIVVRSLTELLPSSFGPDHVVPSRQP